MKNKPFYVGKVDGSGRVYRFGTLKEAEAKIARLEKRYPDAVHAGEYYIDGPEEKINPKVR